MSCEKQFLPANSTFIYCSESCRLHDQAPAYTRSHSYSSAIPTSPIAHTQLYSRPSSDPLEGPDIIPRFSPTQSRPRSYFNSDPFPSIQTLSEKHPPSPSSEKRHSKSSTALASLRELATALPPPRRRDTDPKDSTPQNSLRRPSSGLWDYIHSPFTSKTAPTTPGGSWTGYESAANRSYGNVYGGVSWAPTGTVVYANTGGMGMDRPLPPRSGPGGYGHRPRSVDLVTPFGP